MAPVFTSGSGSDVLQIQGALNKAGRSSLPPLAEDGILGPKTKARIIEFQKSKGLQPDGIVGPKTRAALGITAPFVVPLPTAPGGTPTAPAGTPISANRVVSVVISAAKSSFASWKQSATLRNISVNAVTASGPPGCLTGSNMLTLITGQLSSLQGDELALAKGAAAGIGANFTNWQNGVTVPGLPWYPSFAAMPGPVAPPTPNVPSPLLALPSGGLPGLTSPPLLQNAMEQATSAALRARAGTIFSDIALQLASFYIASFSGILVRNVLGTGPVPTFAPPFVPVGPVVGGIANSIPGSLT